MEEARCYSESQQCCCTWAERRCRFAEASNGRHRHPEGRQAEFGFQYTEQVPLISAALGAGFDPSWDYGAGPKQEELGTKWMYVLVKAPKGMTSGRAPLDLEADVLVRGVRLPITFWRKQEQAARQLTVSLWG